LIQGGAWQKIQTYLIAKRIQGQIKDLLLRLKKFMEKEENIYGFSVKYSKNKDSSLVTTMFTTVAYPSTNEIYQYISSLKAYVAAQGAKETNYPMLHVKQVDSNQYETMIAIPTNRSLPGQGDIVFKRLVMDGNFLETEVRGGPVTAQAAMGKMGAYLEDHKLASPAIPFMSLVTDRSKEKDTAKWVTKIFYPVY
jgi:hypothetical protein